MRHRGVCASLTCRQRTTSLPDARLRQCYMQWTALKATRVCRLRRPATRWPSPWNPPSQSAPSDAVPFPAFDGTDDERARLHALLNQYAHGFTQDDLDLGYTEAVQHRLPTSDDAAVAQPYRSIPPNQLQEVKGHIKGLLAQSLWRATVPTQLRWSWWGRRTAVFGSVLTTGDWTWRLLVMPTHSPGSRSPWMHWWGPSTSRPWTSPVGTTRSPWIPGTSTRQRSRHLSACMNTQGCRWAWRQPLPPSSVWCRQPCQTLPSGFCLCTSTTSLSIPRRSTNTWSTWNDSCSGWQRQVWNWKPASASS